MVVCAYTEERWEYIVEALVSLKNQDVRPLEILMVVDYDPGLLKRLEVTYPDLVVVPNEHGRGLSGARNTGVEHADGDIVVFMDDDAYAASDWLRNLIAGYENQRVIGVGGLVEPVWFDRAPSWLPKQFLWIVGCSFDGLPKGTAPIRNPIGANMSFRRSMFAEVGMFREGLGRQTMASPPFGCEETELAIRAVRGVVGSRIVHEPSAVVHHHVPSEKTTWHYFVRRCLMEGRSKAAVSRSVGRHDALSVERRYVLRVLTEGAARELIALGRHRDGAALRRLAALFAGVGLACLGYLREVTFGSRQQSARDLRKCEVSRTSSSEDASPGLIEDGRPDVSVIVCTHLVERFGWLVECLDAVQRQSTPPLEVIVVVDGKPEIRRLLEERNGPEIILSTPRPSGLSVARNTGIGRATGRCVAFLDDDAIPDIDWLRRLRIALSQPNVAGASGLSEPRWEGDAPAWLPPELYWAIGCSYEGMPKERAEVRNVFGGCACFDRRLFERFGGFHPDLGRTQRGLAGCEETEFCQRVLRNTGTLRFLHEPAAVISHRVPRARQRVSYLLRRCRDEGRSKAIFHHEATGFPGSLSLERSYLTRTVPMALRRDLLAATKGDPAGLGRFVMLIGGIVVSGVSFVLTAARWRVAEPRLAPDVNTFSLASTPPDRTTVEETVTHS